MKHSFLRLIVLFVALSTPVLAAERSDLPNKGLENRVDFWKKIFTQYGADDVVIHDKFYVNLIYGVADDSNVNYRIGIVGRTLDEISANLSTPENLSPAAQQVYASMQENGVPLTQSALTDLRANIHTQRGIKERFHDGVVRSGRYVDAFEGIMKAQGVPAQLALLPLVESSFQNNAKSKAAAIGVWQFTRSTGKLYMNVSSKSDDRLDPLKATRGAAKLLHDNYSALGSWPLAITAYNHGRAGMVHAKNEVGPDLPSIIDQYRGPVFGYASMNFYSEFLAAVFVYENYPRYFGALALDKPMNTESKSATVTAVALAKTTTTTAKKTKPVVVATKYKVKNGDTLATIAQRFKTSIRELMQANNLDRSAIYAGQILLVK